MIRKNALPFVLTWTALPRKNFVFIIKISLVNGCMLVWLRTEQTDVEDVNSLYHG